MQTLISGCNPGSQSDGTLSLPGAFAPTEAVPKSAIPAEIVSASDEFVEAVSKVRGSMALLEAFFGEQGSPGDNNTHSATGTCWVINAGGFLVTNAHVIEGSETLRIRLGNRSFTSETYSVNVKKDLAVIKVNAKNLPVPPLGDSSKLRLGQHIAAIGNALNLGIRISCGVVSFLGATISYHNDLVLDNLIETDAAINPGNSGGVIINSDGEVVGITNAGLGVVGDIIVEGFGYAIPINDAIPVIEDLISQLE